MASINKRSSQSKLPIPFIVILVLAFGIATAGFLNLANNAANQNYLPENANNIKNALSPTGNPRGRLQLETLKITPGAQSLSNTSDGLGGDGSGRPGSFPNLPTPPIPTVILANLNCTYTIGFWKTHAGFGPQQDVVTPLLPIWLGTPSGAKSVNVNNITLAVQVLMMNNDARNGINKLYAQLLGAKLNIKSGADSSDLPLSVADGFLATHNQYDWTSLSATEQNQVISWAARFDNYNNGLAGPNHCQ